MGIREHCVGWVRLRWSKMMEKGGGSAFAERLRRDILRRGNLKGCNGLDVVVCAPSAATQTTRLGCRCPVDPVFQLGERFYDAFKTWGCAEKHIVHGAVVLFELVPAGIRRYEAKATGLARS